MRDTHGEGKRSAGGRGLSALSGSRGWQIGIAFCIALAVSQARAETTGEHKSSPSTKGLASGKGAAGRPEKQAITPPGSAPPGRNPGKSIGGDKSGGYRVLTPPMTIPFDVPQGAEVQQIVVVTKSETLTVSLDQDVDGDGLGRMVIIGSDQSNYCKDYDPCDFPVSQGVYILRVKNIGDAEGKFQMNFTRPAAGRPPLSNLRKKPPHKPNH
jgi:hypothetical protein